MKKQIINRIRNNRLSYRLLLYILLCSTCFSIIASSLQLYAEYKDEMRKIDAIIDQIEESYLGSLEVSMWVFDLNLIHAQLNGILTIPSIRKVVLYELIEDKEKILESLGTVHDKNLRTRRFVLKHDMGEDKKKIGFLVVYAGLDDIYRKIIRKAMMIFLTKIVEIFLLSLCILIIFHHLIMKHLIRLADYLRNIDPGHLDKTKLDLKRKKTEKNDILDLVVDAFDEISERLVSDIQTRKKIEEQLRTSNTELLMNRQEAEKQNLIKTGQMDFSEILRGDQEVGTLADGIVSFLCKYLNAGAGIFYIVDETGKIKPVGFYAHSVSRGNVSAFHIGEGLVGQAVQDKRKTVIRKCPENYLNISSGLGESGPGNIMIFPFVREGIVSCAVEIGTFKDLSVYDYSFMEQISESVAIAIESAIIRTQKSTLIEEFREQTKELKAREKAFRRSEEKFRLIFDNSVQFIGLLNTDGSIMAVNRTALEFLGKKHSEIEGGNFWDMPWGMIEEEKRTGLKHVIEDCSNGFEINYEMDFSSDDDSVVGIYFSFSPVVDESGTVSQILVEGLLK